MSEPLCATQFFLRCLWRRQFVVTVEDEVLVLDSEEAVSAPFRFVVERATWLAFPLPTHPENRTLVPSLLKVSECQNDMFVVACHIDAVRGWPHP
jgi:hypothetical protein